MRCWWSCVLVCVAALWPAVSTAAVPPSGYPETAAASTLKGRVVDATGGAVAGALVSISSERPGAPASSVTNLEGQFSVNGQRTNSNYFMVDGVSVNFGTTISVNPSQSLGGSLPALTIGGGTNSFVSVDAMQEFRTLTSTYAAEFGRNPGAQIAIGLLVVEQPRESLRDRRLVHAKLVGLARAQERQKRQRRSGRVPRMIGPFAPFEFE